MAGPLAETRYGTVEGLRSGDVRVWRGIPFARAPVGELRFGPPQPPEPWSGVRDATRFGPVSWQVPALALLAPVGEEREHQSEDCLNLNVWSPAADGGRRPVLVWIHGGAFVWGSGQTPWYDGTSFAAQGDVVVVTINYRLGPFGFLHLGGIAGAEYADSGNCGILDQIAALRWVRENIAAFGGDPERVTVAGQSAGSISVGMLLARPDARGLFRQAIMASGTPGVGLVNDPERADGRARALLAALQIPPAEWRRLLDVPAEALLAAAGPRTAGLGWLPVQAGPGLPEVLGRGDAAGIPLMVGTNRDEFNLYGVDPAWAAMDDAALLRAAGPLHPRLHDHYLAGRRGRDLMQAVMDLTTDRVFWYPAQRAAALQSVHAPVWVYRFDWESRATGGALRACHALDTPFAFHTIEGPHGKLLTGESPDLLPLARAFHAAWTGFVRDGDPGWPRYELARRPVMLFNTESHVVHDPGGDARRVWEQVG